MKNAVLVLGAGVIGLSCAWRAARAGWAVTVLDPAPASGASWVAGGMLAPVTEAWPGEESLLALGVASVQRWPGFAAELDAAGCPAGLRTDGTVIAATGSGDRAELDALATHLARLGRPVEQLSGRELRRREPSIGPDVRGGLSVPGDLAVDNRMLLHALRHSAEQAGVAFVLRAAARVLDDGERVVGVRCVGGSELPAEAVVLCAGAFSAELHPVLRGLVRPVKGEILRLAHRPGALPPPRRTVRALVDGRSVYLVPRGVGSAGRDHRPAAAGPAAAGGPGRAAASGPGPAAGTGLAEPAVAESTTRAAAHDRPGLVIGATQHETGFDCEVTVGGVRDLLRDAERVLPGIAEYALVEASAGLRPGSPDNLPLVGPSTIEGLVVATGHGRNGILLAPITADAVVATLGGQPVPEVLRPADPRRFAPAEPATSRRTLDVGDPEPEEVSRVRVDQR